VRDKNSASAGRSREHPGAAVAAAGLGIGLSGVLAADVGGAVPSSPCSALSVRVMCLRPGTQRFSRFSFFEKIATE
jgi:hypothetical protein